MRGSGYDKRRPVRTKSWTTSRSWLSCSSKMYVLEWIPYSSQSCCFLLLSYNFPPPPPSRRTLTRLWRCTKSSGRQRTARPQRRVRHLSLCWMRLRCSSSLITQPPSSRPHRLWLRQSSRAWCHPGPHWVSWGRGLRVWSCPKSLITWCGKDL